jgi:hypothetical protein
VTSEVTTTEATPVTAIDHIEIFSKSQVNKKQLKLNSII